MYEFSKRDSKTLKAIASILMLAHHCFRNLQTLEDFNVVTIMGIDTLVYFGNFCKICVSLFVFVSGYGLFLAFNKLYDKHLFSLKAILKEIIIRYVKLMRDYWVVALISYVVMQILTGKTFKCFFENKSFLDGLSQIVMNFLGFDDMLGFSNDFNGAWWYMSFAIFLLFIAPIVVIMLRKSRFTRYLLFVSIIIFPRLFLTRDNATTHYYQFLFAYILGSYSAYRNLLGNIKYKCFQISNTRFKSIIIFVLFSLIFVISYEVRKFLPYKYYFDIVWGIVPFIFIVYAYLYFFPYIYKIGDFIGHYSTYIFLIHLFVKNDLLYDMLYSLQYPILIILVLLIICILIGIIVDWLRHITHYDFVINKIIFAINKI